MQLEESDVNPYLQQEVMSASPARLRWMLIRRAEDLCEMVNQLWASGQQTLGDQWMLRIREILGELLEGVKDPKHPLSSAISNFYLFLLQMSLQISQNRELGRLQTLRELLAIEGETWQLVVEKTGTEALSNPQSASLFPSLSSSQDSQELLNGGFSLEV
jgi:flagellar protein FliS